MARAMFSHLTATPEEIDPAGQEFTKYAAVIQADAAELRREMTQLDADWKGRGALNWIPPLCERLKVLEEMANILQQMGGHLKSAAQVYETTDSAWGKKFETLFTTSEFAGIPDFPGGQP